LSKGNSSGQFQEIIPAVTGMNGEEYEEGKKENCKTQRKIRKENTN